MSKAKIKRLDATEAETARLQQVFLDGFLRYKKFTAGCNAVQNEIGDDVRAEVLVVGWLEDDPDFKAEHDKARDVVNRVNVIKAEEFLCSAGTGAQSAGKGMPKLANAEVAAAHHVLEAYDKQKWSSKVAVEKTESKTITTIIKHYGPNDSKTEVIDAPEVKELTSGNSDDNE